MDDITRNEMLAGLKKEEARKIGNFAQRVYDTNEAKGFNAEIDHHTAQILARLMLVVTEVAEAAEGVRAIGDDRTKSNLGEELADTIIRCMHIAKLLDIDIEQELITKANYNDTRPRMHGKRA